MGIGKREWVSHVGVTERCLVEEALWYSALMSERLGVKFDSESV